MNIELFLILFVLFYFFLFFFLIDKLRDEIKTENIGRRKATAEAMQATALGKSLNNEIERLKVSLDASEKSKHRLQAMFDDAKQIASDMKRQLKLGALFVFLVVVHPSKCIDGTVI